MKIAWKERLYDFLEKLMKGGFVIKFTIEEISKFLGERTNTRLAKMSIPGLDWASNLLKHNF